MKVLLMFSLLFCLTACFSQKTDINLAQNITDNAQKMAVNYQVVSNTQAKNCDAEMAEGNCYIAQLNLRFAADLPAQGWHIYFSHLSPIQEVTSEEFVIEHLNGDLHKLSSKKSIEAGKNYQIKIKAGFWSVSKSDVLPNYFFVYNNDNQTAIIKSTQEQLVADSVLPIIPHAGEMSLPEQFKRNIEDNSVLATAEFNFERNQTIFSELNSTTNQQLVIPSILNKQVTDNTLDISAGLAVSEQSLVDFSSAFALLKNTGIQIKSQKADTDLVNLNIDLVTSLNQTPNEAEANQEISKQAYQLHISNQNIQIKSTSYTGAFYALMSLKQLVENNALPVGQFNDSPRYEFRGVHLDVARNFRSVNFVKQLIQNMAQWKLNKLHLHLADDEGWRLAIQDLPELTQVGGFRCFDPTETQCLMPQLGSGPNRSNPNNGFYSQQDYRELVQYAAAHHVEIIPSLDMPGHSRSSIKSMEARYQRLVKQERYEQAKQYLLTDFDDKSQYSSVQHYNDNTLNPCLSSTYTFVDKVLSNLIQQHKDAGVPLTRYHLGADETAGAWHDSPVCHEFIAQNKDIENVEQLGGYFITRVAQLIQDKGIIAGGWSDGMREFQPDVNQPMQVNVWDLLMWQGHLAAEKFQQQGWRTILSYPDVLYFDFPYAVDPNEHGYYWATRATDSYKVFQFMPDNAQDNAKLWVDRMGNQYTPDPSTSNSPIHFEGIQTHLWSEIIRHDSVAEYMYYPRLISFAEKAWVKPDWETQSVALSTQALTGKINANWYAFSKNLVNKQLPNLITQNQNFRLPPPGAQIKKAELHMNHIFGEGVQLEYQQTPNQWQTYIQPIKVKPIVKIRAKLTNTNSADKPRYSAVIELK
ncbi:carbohydate-binding domain-containing protein [Paraglaciecola aquimarina]|uniref:beta-N-acetylhexosaminidase n=1 Tax=Paraglaciecola algarum TaxID=3050085 RepID=A0ABS9DAA4_9ALTE|nr:family 20 glycosylhydrolase [Paraglaciecola sp. G1-23]MCF2948937.1 carbohydate-binding domain-containing protein [Paraglaciecola sp. G1-23]